MKYSIPVLSDKIHMQEFDSEMLGALPCPDQVLLSTACHSGVVPLVPIRHMHAYDTESTLLE
jgi:hypothetical protein